MANRRQTQNEKLLAHAAEGERNPAESAVARSMLVARGNPLALEGVDGIDVTGIVKRAEQALELALSVQDIKRVRDEAATLSDYLTRRGFGEGAAAKATRIVRLAEWKAGAELIRMVKSHERVKQGDEGGFRNENALPRRSGLPTLAELGVLKGQAELWQRLARAVEYDRLSTELERRVAAGEPLTFAAIERALAPVTTESVAMPATWSRLIGRVKNDAAALYALMGSGDPQAADRSPDEWRAEAVELEAAIRQLVVFLRAMQVYQS